MAEELRLALVQTSIIWENPEANRANFANLIQGISSEPDLIVLPEMFTTGFTMTPNNVDLSFGKDTLAWMQETARSKNAAIVGSIACRENDKYTNRLYFVTPAGKIHHYDKRHTFTLAGEHKVYESGNNRLVVDYKGFKICPMICYDLRFPVWTRCQGDYEVLLFVANWPAPRISAWDTLLRARAIENMAYCIGVNRVGEDANNLRYPGHSAVYDVLGNQLVYSEREEILYTSIKKEHIIDKRAELSFLEDRDAFDLSGLA